MAKLPDVAIKALSAGKPVVLATCSSEGVPNAIWASCCKLLEDGRFVIADNYFDKTRANILENTKVAVTVLSDDVGSVQIKGVCARLTEGPEYEDMLTWVSENHPREAACVISIEEVWNGSKDVRCD